MRKSLCPSFTSLPSVKSRFSTIPFTRARTSATRNGEVRPGSSWVSVTDVGSIVTTPTSTGPAGAARFASDRLQAMSRVAASRTPDTSGLRRRRPGRAAGVVGLESVGIRVFRVGGVRRWGPDRLTKVIDSQD